MKFFIEDFFTKCEQIRRKMWIWSYLLQKSLMENFIFCAVIDFSFPKAVNLSHAFLHGFLIISNFVKFYLQKKPNQIPAGNYMFKVNNINTRTRCEICSKLTITTPGRHWRRSGVFIVNFEYISHLVLVFLLLTLNR